MTDPPPPLPFDQQKLLLEMKRQDAQRAFDRWDSQFDILNDAAVKIADSALRAAMLINGGAAVSVLAFIGGIAAKDLITVSQLSQVASSLVLFAFGVAAAVVGMGLSYMTHFFGAGRIGSFKRQFEFPYLVEGPTTKRYVRTLAVTHSLAFVSGIASIGFFIAGIYAIRDAIGHLAH
jgi:hypothetical protein